MPRWFAGQGELGVELKWFGAAAPHGFTSSHHSWCYLEAQILPGTDRVLSTLFDLRLPLSFSLDDCRQIGVILRHVIGEVSRSG